MHASSGPCASNPAACSFLGKVDPDRAIAFGIGSRLDVYLPEGVRPLVAEGQTAIAGETIIADLRAGDPQRSFRVG